MSPPFVFIHGWGFNASLWQGILAQLPGIKATCLDFGFIGERPNAKLEIPDKAVIVGHSLGVLWALKHLPQQPHALISIGGFDRFSPPVPRAGLEIMKRGLKRNPMAQMTHFWRSCGIEPFAPAEQLNPDALLGGLDDLMNEDARGELKSLSCPVLALAALHDKIIAETMSRSIWQEQQIVWSKDGGHALPFTHPKWCAQKIDKFVESLQADDPYE